MQRRHVPYSVYSVLQQFILMLDCFTLIVLTDCSLLFRSFTQFLNSFSLGTPSQSHVRHYWPRQRSTPLVCYPAPRAHPSALGSATLKFSFSLALDSRRTRLSRLLLFVSNCLHPSHSYSPMQDLLISCCTQPRCPILY